MAILTYNRNKHSIPREKEDNRDRDNKPKSVSILGGQNRNDDNNNRRNSSDKDKMNLSATLERFVNEISENSKDIRNVRAILVDSINPVATAIFKLSRSDNRSDANIVNKAIAAFGLGTIPQTLKTLIAEGIIDTKPYNDNGYFESVFSYMVSRILMSSKALNLTEDIIDIYLSIFDIVNGTSITMLADQCGIDKTFATDILISYPIAPSMMDNTWIETNYPKFLARIMGHAEENQSVLDSVCISKIFEFIFGNNLTKGKVAPKIIGKYLGNKPSIFNDDPMKSIYVEFVKFLYETLNEYDDNTIVLTLRSVANARNKGIMTLFDDNDASGFENIANIWKTIR